MKKAINPDQICTINIERKKLCSSYHYREFKKSFWGNIREGYYYKYHLHREKLVTEEEIKNNGCYCEDLDLFLQKPEIDNIKWMY